ncbi:MAG: penicillin-binding protein [Gaiellaceae bacterium]|nr:penicillin-binding protein [Gaiellaceae bacterium]
MFFVVLSILGLTSFTAGVLTAVRGEAAGCDPTRRHPQVNGIIFAGDGHTELAVLRGRENRTIVPEAKIAPIMEHAIVDIEDRRYYDHGGVDLRGMARALWADVSSGTTVQGGSTITQQFIKVACVSNQHTIARKLREALLARQLTLHWSKPRILTAYLNTIYYGNGAYGIQQAAVTYFGHGASKLTLPEAALLAGIPEGPSLWDPILHPVAAGRRRALVLDAMVSQNDITQADADRANEAPLPKRLHVAGTQGPAPYFTDYVKQQLVERFGDRTVYGGGIKVQTTIDLGLQKLAHAAIRETLTSTTGPTAALVAIDPRDGRILAMVGGANYHQSQFNLAVQGKRQPGSSFKPFVLATALREGVSPQNVFESKPQSNFLGDRYWSVHNFDNEYLGPTTVENGTIHSDNAVYAQLTQLVGPANVAKTAHALGVTSPLNGYFSIGLGAEAVNPLEMARAYSTFANAGTRVDGKLFGNAPRAVLTLQKPGHSLIANLVKPVPVLSSENAAIVGQLLQEVVQSGTGTHAQLPDRPVAGKTGTTENYGDAWFVGYTPQLAVAVWVGYPNKLVPMLTEYHGKAVAGGTFPADVFKRFMGKAFPYLAKTEPEGNWSPASLPSPSYGYASSKLVTFRDGKWLLDNGNCRRTESILYFSGYGPSRTAPCKPNEVDVVDVIGVKRGDAIARLLQQPLKARVLYRVAPGRKPGYVIAQTPRGGTLSSWQTVTLVVAKRGKKAPAPQSAAKAG